MLVADGAAPPIDKACGEGLMPDGVEALRHLGVTIPKTQARPFRGIRFVNQNQRAEAAFPARTALGIRRTSLHQILTAHAAAVGAYLLWRAPVTGLQPVGAMVGGELVRARWVVGADGTASRVRRWAGLDTHRRNLVRFAQRRHYRVVPWTDFVEVHWARGCQFYLTPVAPAEVCVAVVSDNPKLGLDDALAESPELSARFGGAEHTFSDRGAITVSHELCRVYRGNVALVGDASAGVDAITGEGLCLAFRQAALLAECLATGDLARYQVEHARLIRRPAFMARLMLFMARHDRLRQRTMQVFESNPRSFAAMLSMHVGAGSTTEYVSSGISLGWQLLKA